MRFPDKKARVWLPISCVSTCQKHRKKKIPPCNGRRHKNNLSAKNPLLSLKRKGENIINGLIMCEPERVT